MTRVTSQSIDNWIGTAGISTSAAPGGGAQCSRMIERISSGRADARVSGFSRSCPTVKSARLAFRGHIAIWLCGRSEQIGTRADPLGAGSTGR